jgi:uncharacterized protein YkwD
MRAAGAVVLSDVERLRVYVVTALLGAAVLLSASARPAAASDGSGAPTPTSVAVLERAIVAEVNAVRRKSGLRTLSYSRGLATAANRHTVAMAERGVFGHRMPGGPSFAARIRREYPPRSRRWSVAENIAAASPAPTAAETVRMWLASPPHRRNVLSPLWRQIGVAAVYAPSAPGDFGDAEVTLVTADFGVRG